MDDKIKKSESEETIRQKTEATPGEQTDAYSAPTEENVEAAVKELNNNRGHGTSPFSKS